MVMRERRGGAKDLACRLCIMNIGSRKEKWYKDWGSLWEHIIRPVITIARPRQQCMVFHLAERWAEMSDTHRESGLGEILGTTGVALHPSFQAVPDHDKVQRLRAIYEKDVSKSAEFKTRRQPGETPQAIRAKVKAGTSKEVQTRPGTKPTMPTKIPYPFGPYAHLRTKDTPQSHEPHEVSSEDGRKEHAEPLAAAQTDAPPGAAIEEHLLQAAPEETHSKASALAPSEVPAPPVPKWQGPSLTPEDLTQRLIEARKEADKQIESVGQVAAASEEPGHMTDPQEPQVVRGADEAQPAKQREQCVQPPGTAPKTVEHALHEDQDGDQEQDAPKKATEDCSIQEEASAKELVGTYAHGRAAVATGTVDSTVSQKAEEDDEPQLAPSEEATGGLEDEVQTPEGY
eukprot:2843582-Amphidinium_carterae.3